MNKNCENKNCSERGFKKVLIRDKKNKEYKVLCIFHYEKYIKKQNLKLQQKKVVKLYGSVKNMLKNIIKSGIFLRGCHKMKSKILFLKI